MNLKLKHVVAGLLALAIASLSTSAFAQVPKKTAAEKKAPIEKAEPTKDKKDRALPARGMLTAIDKVAKTLTIGERVFQVTADTKFYKGEKTPATMTEGVVGEPVRLSYYKTADGKLTAHNVYFGAKPDAKAEGKKKEGSPKAEGKKKSAS